MYNTFIQTTIKFKGRKLYLFIAIFRKIFISSFQILTVVWLFYMSKIRNNFFLSFILEKHPISHKIKKGKIYKITKECAPHKKAARINGSPSKSRSHKTMKKQNKETILHHKLLISKHKLK